MYFLPRLKDASLSNLVIAKIKQSKKRVHPIQNSNLENPNQCPNFSEQGESLSLVGYVSIDINFFQDIELIRSF